MNTNQSYASEPNPAAGPNPVRIQVGPGQLSVRRYREAYPRIGHIDPAMRAPGSNWPTAATRRPAWTWNAGPSAPGSNE
ncbi:MAG: hypothetical protein ABI847_03215 [Anaerolineales bacterium]